jgi:hypothetical protein
MSQIKFTPLTKSDRVIHITILAGLYYGMPNTNSTTRAEIMCDCIRRLKKTFADKPPIPIQEIR